MLLALRGEKEKEKFVQNRLYNRKKKKKEIVKQH